MVATANSWDGWDLRVRAAQPPLPLAGMWVPPGRAEQGPGSGWETTAAGGIAGLLRWPGEPSLHGQSLGSSSQGQSLPHTLAFTWPSEAKPFPLVSSRREEESFQALCLPSCPRGHPAWSRAQGLSLQPSPWQDIGTFQSTCCGPAPLFAESGTRVNIPPIKEYTFLNTKIKTMRRALSFIWLKVDRLLKMTELNYYAHVWWWARFDCAGLKKCNCVHRAQHVNIFYQKQ